MWRIAAPSLLIAAGLSLTACLPRLPGTFVPSPQTLPTPLPGRTARAEPSQAAAAQASPGATIMLNTGDTFTAIPSFTPTNNAGSLLVPGATGTSVPATQTAAILTSVSLDELSPGTVFKPVRIVNRSRAQMDISLHCTTLKGQQTVLEFDGVRSLSVQAPEGNYVYVIYVGGRQLVGSFSLLNNPKATITVYADRVAIQ